jgi:hypothetical protein
MAFAKLKAHLRTAKARTIEALWQAVGYATSTHLTNAETISNTPGMLQINGSML